MGDQFDVVVQKFGGSSLASAQKIKDVAQFIKERLRPAQKACVVVSAMGHTTNDLLALAKEISDCAPKRELDMLVSCGERSSMALLSMALNHIGIKAKSLTGSQAGIITDGNHQSAELKSIRPGRVFEAFHDHQVVVLAGFQGVCEAKEITTLKRGGSDTTAVAMAAALGATCCEIYSDVMGVMDADPRIVASAQLLPQINFRQMNAMALYGARILAHDAIELAALYGVNVSVGRSCHGPLGTRVSEFSFDKSWAKVSCITHLRALTKVEMPLEDLSSDMPEPLLCAALANGAVRGYFSNDMAQKFVGQALQGGLALVTLHSPNHRWCTEVFLQSCARLAREDVVIHDAILGQSEIFLVLDDHRLEEALRALHAQFMGKDGER